MKKESKVVVSKSGIRNYEFESVKKDKDVSHYDQHFGYWSEHKKGMFYKKSCLYCLKTYEGKRADTAFCCQSCQKAHLRLRRKGLL
ncbi:hypothetical protein CLV58_1539 [Spirosoma oryzae]|uniref:Uncharacterized protein n=1 Tax=Spirosoma oryzae TaxID=1469603 RepID=A0A2T0RIY6_9BACT|nr:hypothetical protein CLV58_1539 [Spirosoma oryzae]